MYVRENDIPGILFFASFTATVGHNRELQLNERQKLPPRFRRSIGQRLSLPETFLKPRFRTAPEGKGTASTQPAHQRY